MARVLLVGQDKNLMLTRAAVLSRLPAEVDWTLPDEAVSRLEHEEYQLVILCHTLGGEADEMIVRTVRQRWAHVEVLRLIAEPWMEPVKNHGVTEVCANPSGLVHVARQMVDGASA